MDSWLDGRMGRWYSPSGERTAFVWLASRSILFLLLSIILPIRLMVDDSTNLILSTFDRMTKLDWFNLWGGLDEFGCLFVTSFDSFLRLFVYSVRPIVSVELTEPFGWKQWKTTIEVAIATATSENWQNRDASLGIVSMSYVVLISVWCPGARARHASPVADHRAWNTVARPPRRQAPGSVDWFAYKLAFRCHALSSC